MIAPPLHVWRLEAGVFHPRIAEDDGWWHSRALEVTLRPTQPFLTIRDRDARQLGLPRRAFEREQRVEQLELELSEAQRRLAEMETQPRDPRGE